jgi:enolase-phosphatase E1
VYGSHLHSARVGSPVALNQVRAILLDIEGTTTPIEFVHEVLFSYARTRVRQFLQHQAADPTVRADIAGLRAEHARETAARPDWDARDELGSAEAYVYWLMDRDRKSTALKSLQGKIWEDGYRVGELRGQGALYPDVATAMRRWRNQGHEIAIFSSGSVRAQRNLFANTTEGDLSPLLSGYFDTTTGPKREAESYRRIAAALRHAPAEILFISDVSEELDAAQAAGMQTALCIRTGAATSTNGRSHPVIHTFDDVLPL